jgi:adenylate cyclase
VSDAQIAEAIAWLIDGARSAQQPHEVLEQLVPRLIAAGLPLWRVAVSVRTLHPNVMARRFIWRPDAPVQLDEAPYALSENPEHLASPMTSVYQSGTVIRRRLVDPDCPMDYGVLPELRDQGITDYLIVPLVFTDGAIHAASWSTQAPEGFSDAHVAAIEAISKPFARVAEIRALRRTAVNLLDAYVGKRSGARILAGHIRRGDVETIEAAFWYSDLRDFTALNEMLAPPELIALLNEYFEAVSSAVAARGGEVLQFIGDAALVVFPARAETGGRRGACQAALGAALAALDAAATVNRARAAARPADLPVRHRLACRRGQLGQCRRRRAARPQCDRPGGQPHRAHRDVDQGGRRAAAAVPGFRRRARSGVPSGRHVRAQGRARTSSGVRARRRPCHSIT